MPDVSPGSGGGRLKNFARWEEAASRDETGAPK